MNNLVEYLIFGKTYSKGGSFYKYIMANNGVWISGSNQHLTAVIQITECEIRGLEQGKSYLKLEHGRLPQRLFDLAYSVLLAEPEKERYVGIRWNGQCYDIYYPEQQGAASRVNYEASDNIVVELHSHGKLKPLFSGTDDEDEQGLKVYGVVGDLYSQTPSLNLRVGVYGYWQPVLWSEIFDGQLTGVIDVNQFSENKGSND